METANRSALHFKEAAKTWDNEATIARNQNFSLRIAKHLPGMGQGLRFLDFGCGTGLLSQAFAPKAQSLLGLDVTKEMLEVFNERFAELSHVTSQLADLEDNPEVLDTKEFDVVLTAMTFHHLKDPKQVLKVLKKHLRPGGQIFIIDLDSEDGSFHPDPKAMGVHHFGFSAEQLNSWAEALGFASFSAEIIDHIEKNQRSYPVRLATFGI